MMVYNNPEASGVDMPAALIARLAAEVEQVVAVKECSGDARRIPALLTRRPSSRCSSAATTGRSRASARARRAGSPASPTARRPSASSSTRPAAPADLERARALYARLLPLARLDMTPKLVQYFKGAQDALGFVGGPVRAPRLALDADDRAILDAALAALRAPAAV